MRYFIATVCEKGGRVIKRQITTDRSDISQSIIIQSVMMLHNPEAIESVSAMEYKPAMLPAITPSNRRPN